MLPSGYINRSLWAAKLANLTIMKVLFLTYGDGSQDFRYAATRLENQARSVGVFDSIIGLHHEDLLAASPEFVQAQNSIVKLDNYPRYFQAMKAWVIHAGLAGYFGEFDLVCYADPGCEIVTNSISRLILKMNLRKAYLKGGLAEQLPHPERNWTKKQTLDFFNSSYEESVKGQIQATWSFWRVNRNNLELASRWCSLSDFSLNLWQDPKDPNGEAEYFIEHRRDQSLFSLLWKEAGLPVKPVSDQWALRLGAIRGAAIPIHTVRNRTGTTTLTRISKRNSAAILGLLLNFLGKYWSKRPKIAFRLDRQEFLDRVTHMATRWFCKRR